MSLTKAVSGATAVVNDVNQIIDLIQGTAGFTESFLLRTATGSDFIVRLADAAGARKVIIQDSNGVTVHTVNSSGDMNLIRALLLNGSAGTAGQVLTSAGASTLPTWSTPASGIDIGAAWFHTA